MKKMLLLTMVFFWCFKSNGQLCFSGELQSTVFGGESKVFMMGPNVKALYFMNDWTGVYAGGSVRWSSTFKGQVEVVAVNSSIIPSSLIKNTEASAVVFDLQFGIRRYLIGDSYGDLKRKKGLYVDALFSLMSAKVKSGKPEYDHLSYESPIEQEVEGQFASYVGGLLVGFERVRERNYMYVEIETGVTIDQANRFVLDVSWPFYFSVNMGIRFNAFN